jgi:hypothetical protein
MIKVCFDTTLSVGTNSSVYCSSTPFVSNIAASGNNAIGCTMESTTSGTLRPNMKLTLRPSFPKKGELDLFEGVRSSISGTDLNNDNLMDIVIGNYTGGVSYYKGDTTGITTGIQKPEIQNIEAVLFPNPCTENITLNFPEALKSNAVADIYNVTGQHIFSVQLQKGQTNLAVNTTNFPSGIYVIVMKTKSHSVVKKFVVSH